MVELIDASIRGLSADQILSGEKSLSVADHSGVDHRIR
jgi:hypothetical protein